MSAPDKARVLRDLRVRVRALEDGGAARRGRFAVGCPALDEALGGGLPRAALHEVAAARAEWDDGAATGFTVVLAARLAAAAPGPLLWVCPAADLYGPGLAGFGLDPRRVILAAAHGDGEALWAMEAGLRCAGLAGAVGEVANLDLSASRRLQLAAEAGGVTGLVLRRQRGAQRPRLEPSAAVSRWRIAAAPALRAPSGASLPARWRVELTRARGGVPGAWMVEWRDATGDLAVAAPVRNRPAAAAPGPRAVPA
jgi:protein ImuA